MSLFPRIEIKQLTNIDQHLTSGNQMTGVPIDKVPIPSGTAPDRLRIGESYEQYW
jgi:hypothetical protein